MRKFTILNIATSEKPETASNTSWSGSTTESDYIQPWVISRPQCSNGVDSKTLLHQSTSAQTQTGLNLWSHFRGAVESSPKKPVRNGLRIGIVALPSRRTAGLVTLRESR